MSNLYVPYQTPPNCHDVPFIYVYDATQLVNGQSYRNTLGVSLDADAQFILRRIAGAQSVAPYFTYRNDSGSYVAQPAFSTLGPASQLSNACDISVVPEKPYGNAQAAGQIKFDVVNVAKAVAATGGTDYLAYIAFAGVKRFPWNRGSLVAACRYYRRSYEYVLNIPGVTWTRGQYMRFVIKVDHGFDFELQGIAQLNGTNVPAIQTGVFNYLLYSPERWHMMSDPVPDSYIVDTLTPLITTDPATMPGTFPSPPMLYPFNSQIVVDLYATQSTPQGDCWQIVFRGQERVPLGGDSPMYGGF